jgi:hypothetical protein
MFYCFMDEVRVSIVTPLPTQSFSDGVATEFDKRRKFAVNEAITMKNSLLKGVCEVKNFMHGRLALHMAIAASLLTGAPAESQTPPAPPTPSYADLADLGLPSPIAAHVRVTRAVRLKGEQALAVPPGKSRFYVEADLVSLLKGPGGLPPRISYLVDLPNDAKGRPPKLERKSEHLLFASPVAERPGELRLAAPDAQLPWSAPLGDQVRAILMEGAKADAPPRITGVGRAFHVPGSLPGESETQIFLQTADGRPVSLNILRRPGEAGRWAVALSEIVDDAAGPPPRNSLLWYRLACSLPTQLPPQSLVEAVGAVGAIQADYRLVRDGLGPCVRTRTP